MQSRVVFENQHYVVCLTSAGLSVQSKRKGDGKLIPTDHEKFNEWLQAFGESIDAQESNLLAKAVYQTMILPIRT